MSEPSLASGVTRLFHLRGPDHSVAPPHETDAHGFVLPSTGLVTFEVLFEAPCALVLAPPWIGKTTVAKGLAQHLNRCREEHIERFDFGTFREFTEFER